MMRTFLRLSFSKVSTACILASLGMVAFAAAPVHAQNLVQNGDFETGDFTDWSVNGNNTSVDAGAGINNSFAASFGAINPEIDTLYQSLNTVVGQQYDLTFSAQTPEFGLEGIVPTTGQPNSLFVTFGGSPVTALEVPDANGYTQYHYTLTAVSGVSTLAFYVSNDNDYTQLDNISVAAVPEASTTVSLGFLLALGTGGLVIAARKRKAPLAV